MLESPHSLFQKVPGLEIKAEGQPKGTLARAEKDPGPRTLAVSFPAFAPTPHHSGPQPS